MDRRCFLLTSLAGALAAPLAANAQQAGDVRKIGLLSNTSMPAARRFVEAFHQGLRDLGWVDSQNVSIEYRWAEGRSELLPGFAAELVGLRPDVIVAAPTPAAVAAKNATGTIPIVAVAVGDPVRLGLVASLARPGGNVTGTSFDVGLQVIGKGLELLNETLPNVRRVAILANSANPGQEVAVRDLQTAARSLRLQVQVLPVRGPNEFDGAFATMRKEHADALLVVADSMFNLHRARLAELAATNRLPAMYGFREFVEAGGLMSYGPSVTDVFRRAAFYVDKILRGARPADLPVEQPTKFELVINLKTAKVLGLRIPPSLLVRADHVIE